MSDQQLEEAVRSKSPQLGRIIENMIAEGESSEDIVLVVLRAAENRIEGANELVPLFVRVNVPIGAEGHRAVLCFAGEPKERVEQIAADYVAAYPRVLKSQQRWSAVIALGSWLIPSFFIYVLGWSAGWIRRGFERSATRW